MKVVGIEHCKFTNKEGKEVSFDRVTLLYDLEYSRGSGQGAEIVNCSPDKSISLAIGEDVEVLYNRYGKVLRFEYVS